MKFPEAIYTEAAKVLLGGLSHLPIETSAITREAVIKIFKTLGEIEVWSDEAFTEVVGSSVRVLAPLPEETRLLLLGGFVECAYAQKEKGIQPKKGRRKRPVTDERSIIAFVNMARSKGLKTYAADGPKGDAPAFQFAAHMVRETMGQSISTDAIRGIYNKNITKMKKRKPGHYKGSLKVGMVNALIETYMSLDGPELPGGSLREVPIQKDYDRAASVYSEMFGLAVTPMEIEDAFGHLPEFRARPSLKKKT